MAKIKRRKTKFGKLFKAGKSLLSSIKKVRSDKKKREKEESKESNFTEDAEDRSIKFLERKKKEGGISSKLNERLQKLKAARNK